MLTKMGRAFVRVKKYKIRHVFAKRAIKPLRRSIQKEGLKFPRKKWLIISLGNRKKGLKALLHAIKNRAPLRNPILCEKYFLS
jgi:hypothetical protein